MGRLFISLVLLSLVLLIGELKKCIIWASYTQQAAERAAITEDEEKRFTKHLWLKGIISFFPSLLNNRDKGLLIWLPLWMWYDFALSNNLTEMIASRKAFSVVHLTSNSRMMIIHTNVHINMLIFIHEYRHVCTHMYRPTYTYHIELPVPSD